jgi:hypothetical protein
MPFEKGQSGNPAGRPKGIPNRLTKYREQVAAHLPEIIDKLVAMAKGGDLQAAKILVDAVIPKPKAVASPVAFELDENSLASAGRSILRATATGDLSPDQAGTMIQALVGQAKLVELDDFEQRLQALEAS